MLDRNNIKKAFLQGLPYSQEITDLIAPLQTLGITDFSYTYSEKNTRKVRLGSNLVHAQHYLARMKNYPDSAFHEKHPKIFNKAILTSMDCTKKSHDNPIVQDLQSHGLGQWLRIQEGTTRKTMEQFWFFSNHKNPEALKKICAQQAKNLIELLFPNASSRIIIWATPSARPLAPKNLSA